MSVKYAWRFDPYKCRTCHFFHVGKYPLKEGARLEYLECELGDRVLGNLKAESWGQPEIRLKNVKKRWRAVFKRLAPGAVRSLRV